MRPCQCAKLVVKDGLAEPYVEGRDCRRCFLFATNHQVNQAWGGDGSLIPVRDNYRPPRPRPIQKSPLPCIHEGQPCPPPPGRDVRRRWLHCESGKGVVSQCQCNVRCDRYEADAPDDLAPSRRHAIMHLLPVPGNGVWQRSLDQLRMRRGLFTGRIVVACCTGQYKGTPLDPPEKVRDCLPAGAELIEVPNNPTRREVVTWKPLWESLWPDLGDSDAVLYCHTKGATRNVDPGNSCQWWASLLWSLALDHWPKIESLLKRYPIVGSFKKVGQGFGSGFGSWHYSGTFFWMRAGDFKEHRYSVAVPAQWWGVEAWPGLAYDHADAGCLFMTGAVPGLDIYSPKFWQSTVRPEYSKWIQENRPSVTGSSTAGANLAAT